jgi:hypothetical protein
VHRRTNVNDQYNQANAPEKYKGNPVEKRLISEEEFFALNEQKKENKAKHPRRSKLTLGK